MTPYWFGPRARRAATIILGSLVVVTVAYLGAQATRTVIPQSELVTTAALAFTMPFVHRYLVALADRVAYGRSGDSYRLLSRFTERIAQTVAIDDVMPQLARTATQAVHSDGGEVRLWLADGHEWRQTWPPDDPQIVAGTFVDLEHRGSFLGRLGVQVSGHSPEADLRTLSELAGHAGLALSNVRLTVELRRRLDEVTRLAAEVDESRTRLLNVGVQEGRRFTAEVEARVVVPLHAAREVLQSGADPAKALAEARQLVQRALDALRDLSAGLYPPVLAARGLAPALELHALRHGLHVAVESHEEDSTPSPDVQAAAFFCAASVMDDVGRNRRCSIHLHVRDRTLAFDVDSDEPLSGETAEVVEDRVAAMGGTFVASPRVAVRLPVADDQTPPERSILPLTGAQLMSR